MLSVKNLRLGKYTTAAGIAGLCLVVYLLIKGLCTLTEATPFIIGCLYLLGAKDPKRKPKNSCNNDTN